jgi:hypothetical protein
MVEGVFRATQFQSEESLKSPHPLNYEPKFCLDEMIFSYQFF